MLLTAGLKKRENSLVDCGGLEGREGMGGGQQSLHNRNGQTALTNSHTDKQFCLTNPPTPGLYCSHHFAKLSSNLFI